MDFLAWHYTQGVEYYIKSVEATVKWFLHYFSIPLLLKTLFSPWKRMVTVDKSPGFNLQKRLEAFSFNMVSIVIGFIARLVLIISGIVFIFVAVMGGVVGFVFWLLIPFFSLEVYTKHKNQPKNYIQKIVSTGVTSKEGLINHILDSVAGKFLTEHLGLTKDEMISASSLKDDQLLGIEVQSFSELMKNLVLSRKLWSEEFFNKKGIIPEDVITTARLWDDLQSDANRIGQAPYGRPGIALELTFGYTPTLDKYASDMSTLKDFSHRLIGRGSIVSRMERVLSSGSNVILTGMPGVGKKTTVYEFAEKAAKGQFGKEMSYKRVLEFDYNTVLSGVTDSNQKKTQLSQILTEAAAAGNVILVIRDLHRIISSEVEGLDYSDLIEEFLEKRKLKIITITQNVDYERFLAPNTRITKYFEKVEVTPPSKEEAYDILLSAASRWEKISKLVITVPALRTILEESDRYITEIPFPEKALELLDSVVSYKEQKGEKVITPVDIRAVLSEKTGISLMKLTKEDEKRLAGIEDMIHQKLVNQDSSVSLIGKTLRAKTIGVVKEDRPLGSFLFLGPTGVGKTETAKVLAKVYFGSEENITRFDMAEFSGSEGLERLIGSVGKNLPGSLTTQIKNRPANLLLLDEIEKATPDILNLFLTLLDEGYLMDAFGKKISGRNLFVIATSNAGAEFIRKSVSEGMIGQELQKKVVDYVMREKIFTPEFLNRFDGVVVYEPLSRENLIKVAKLMLVKLADNLRSKNIKLFFDESVAVKLSEDGYDPAFGARPMKRIINLILGDLVGKAILEGRVSEGDSIKIFAGKGKEEFLIEKSS